ncbi:hypothetical protein GRQ65_01845 [Nocardioides sp. YIM 123512]|uniref:Ornithine cyclodeaminase/mu-crystallin family protein n=1 Tax=Nocardioides flavescens TaxID=2691959 RepID=A0A6L7ENU3_9ACTN|nr:hypothetical protein [Nocardioides flavescens]
MVALLDGHSVTGYRTAATSALAVGGLAARGPLDVAVIGSGFEARHHLRALAVVRSLRRVRVFSPRATSRAAYADALADVAEVEPAESAESAVAAASVVICAARSRDESPTLLGAWLAPGATVVSVGSTLPEQREVDVTVLERAGLLVADVVEEVLEETGDLLVARAAGVDVRADRGAGRRGRRPPRRAHLHGRADGLVHDDLLGGRARPRPAARGHASAPHPVPPSREEEQTCPPTPVARPESGRASASSAPSTAPSRRSRTTCARSTSAPSATTSAWPVSTASSGRSRSRRSPSTWRSTSSSCASHATRRATTSSSSTTRAGATSSRTSGRSAAPRTPVPSWCCCPARHLLPRDPAGGLRRHPRGVRRDRPGGHPVPDVPVGLRLAHPPLRPPGAPDPTPPRRLPEHRGDQGRGRLPQHHEHRRVPPPLR